MGTMLGMAIDSQLADDGFKLSDELNRIASDFAARGFSQPPGMMYRAIDELCTSRMQRIFDVALVTYRERASSGFEATELKADLVAYLQSRLGSLAATATGSYNRPPSQSSAATMESKLRSFISRAEQA